MIKNKYFLYITEFFAGMSIMAVELGASRLLAPYFSSSQIVWTIIIGTIMIALAIGNVIGGRMADKDANPDRFYKRVLIAGVWIAAIPVVGKYVIAAVSGVLALLTGSNFLIWASLFSCLILFVYPLILLGTATPSLVKYTVNTLDDNGKIVGTLGALNTIGSIIGTFIPTFITIPSVGTNATFIIFAAILLAVGIIYFVSVRRNLIKSAIAIVLFLAFTFFSIGTKFVFWDDGLLYEGESIYNYLQVTEDEDSITLSTNVMFTFQSVKMKEEGLTGMYYDYALASLYMAGLDESSSGDMLILGMGSGTFAYQSMAYFNDVAVEGVEIDNKIIDLSREYFDLSENVQVTNFDGRAFLAETDKKYDVIMVDAYQDITIPFQMSTVEFFTLVKNRLTENGVMIVNMNMHSDAKGSINEALSDTIASVFPNMYTVEVKNGTNKELFASNNMDMKDKLGASINDIGDSELKAMMRTVYSNLENYTAGSNILTDDKAPVEVLGMRALDEIIAEEMEYYREVINEDGISGLLDE